MSKTGPEPGPSPEQSDSAGNDQPDLPEFELGDPQSQPERLSDYWQNLANQLAGRRVEELTDVQRNALINEVMGGPSAAEQMRNAEKDWNDLSEPDKQDRMDRFWLEHRRDNDS